MAFYDSRERPALFDLLTLDESYDRVDWDRVIGRLRTHPHEASWFVPGSAATVRHGGYYGSLIHDDSEDDDDTDSDNDGGSAPLVGWTALHTAMYVDPTPEAVEALLVSFSRASAMESSRGDVPLHFARFTEIVPGVVRSLLRAAPSAILAENNDGLTPLDEMCSWWVNTVDEGGEIGKAGGGGPHDEEELDVPIGAGRERDAQWYKIELMLRAASVVRRAASQQGDGEDSSPHRISPRGSSAGGRRRPRRRFRPLHAAADLCCPPEVLRHAHSRDPSQIYTRDERTGRPPLSTAVASSVISGKSDSESRSVVAELLALNPAAASAVDRDGRLPLHLALESLLTWEGGVESLLGAAPRALRTRDVITHLYPFMAAAVGGAGGLCADVTTIFMLLRNGPEMAAGMADDPPWRRVERRWEARLEGERGAHAREVDDLQSRLAAVALERDATGNELAEAREGAGNLRDENSDLRAELERMKDEMGILSRIGDELQREDDLVESETSCQKRQRKDTNG